MLPINTIPFQNFVDPVLDELVITPLPFNQYNNAALSVHPVTDLTFSFFKADFTFDFKLHYKSYILIF